MADNCIKFLKNPLQIATVFSLFWLQFLLKPCWTSEWLGETGSKQNQRLPISNDIHPFDSEGKLTEDNARGILQTEGELITSPYSYPEFHLMDPVPERSRSKRGVQQYWGTWGYQIPYVIDDSFLKKGGEKHRQLLKRSIRWVMNSICVNYTDITEAWNRSDPKWFEAHGYINNTYVWYKDGSGCWGLAGMWGNHKPSEVLPCYSFRDNTHETLHTLGATHTQQGADRDNYVSVNLENVQKNYRFAYGKHNADQYFFSEGFDSASIMYYADYAFSVNGLETFYPVRDDMMQLETPRSPDATVFHELNRLFKCYKNICNQTSIVCGMGYHSVYKGKCQCVCPVEFNSTTGCTSLINQAKPDLSWPATPIAFLASDLVSACPPGFQLDSSWFTLEGVKPLTLRPDSLLGNQGRLLPVCTKPGPSKDKLDWESWPPGGNYCILKPKAVACGGAFREFQINLTSVSTVHYGGQIWNVDINDTNVILKFCCRNEEPSDFTLEDIPDGSPFRLFDGYSCPIVRGLREYREELTLNVGPYKTEGAYGPRMDKNATRITFFTCYYLPPIYDCNENITLNSSSSSVTITTPGFNAVREPNRRCLYHFWVPKFARIRVTFTTLDVDPHDFFRVKRFYKWQEPYRMRNLKADTKQILSQADYLSMEFWSSRDPSTNKGVNFTVDVIVAEELCYNPALKGANYTGDKNISETYEDCLPWSLTTDCDDFPKEGMSPVMLLTSGNKCRNPDGRLLEPWCFTYKNGTNCKKRFCDVCNLKSPIDLVPNCANLSKADPDFCRSGVQRNACFLTCRTKQASTKRTTCSAPQLPSDGRIDGQVKSEYLDGEKVTVACIQSRKDPKQQMVCTRTGWTRLTQACANVNCPDGWKRYDHRCIYISKNRTTALLAEKECASFGPTGTLFQVWNNQDAVALRNYKKEMKDYHLRTTWISGERKSDKQWYFTDTNTRMTYFNWSSFHVRKLADSSNNCVRIVAEYYRDAGGWSPRPCKDREPQNFACQLTPTCVDRISTDTCEEILSAFPEFCIQQKFRSTSMMACNRSCGHCSEKYECKIRPNISFKLTSDKKVFTGEVMNFSCKPGYYHVSGQLQRACSSSGRLLGEPLVCKDQPVAQDINLHQVITRRSGFRSNYAMLVVVPEQRVPFSGRISRWYYYCMTAGRVHFLVYRPEGENYTYIGSNQIVCETGWKWSSNVPESQQIRVSPGDVFGVYSPDSNTLYVSYCSDYIARNPQSFKPNINKPEAIKYSGASCTIVSAGYRIIPT